MKSNGFFSFSRFYLLLRNDMLLNYKKYIFTIVGAIILGYIILYIQMPTRQYQSNFGEINYTITFTTCLIGLGAFIGLSFPALSSKTTTMNYLLMPSSSFEKFASQFLIRVIIGTFMFFIIFWLDAYLARATALISLSKIEHAPQIKVFEFSYLFTSTKNEPPITAAIVAFFVSAGIFLFSVRIFFKKLAMIKTGIALAALIVSVAILVVAFSHIFYPGTDGMDFEITTYKIYKTYDNRDIWLFSMFYFSWIFFLPLGYFKLKEKQV
jgi:hypothetical protein